MDIIIQWINIYPLDSTDHFVDTYPLDSDLCKSSCISFVCVCVWQDFSMECGICYAYRLNDLIPDKACDDSRCGQPFHSLCLYEVSRISVFFVFHWQIFFLRWQSDKSRVNLLVQISDTQVFLNHLCINCRRYNYKFYNGSCASLCQDSWLPFYLHALCFDPCTPRSDQWEAILHITSTLETDLG